MKALEVYEHGESYARANLPKIVFAASIGIVLAAAAILKAYKDVDAHDFSHIHFVDKHGKWLGQENELKHLLKCDGKYVIVEGKVPVKKRVGKKRIVSIVKHHTKPEVVSV